MGPCPLLLIDACCEAYDNPDFVKHDIDGDGYPETFCNVAVQFIAKQMGCQDFIENSRANEMISFMSSSVFWKKIDIQNAQQMANEGHLVVLGFADHPHGHVVVVRPGIEKESSKWGIFAPKVVNIGAKNSIAVSANWVFPGLNIPTAFLWIQNAGKDEAA